MIKPITMPLNKLLIVEDEETARFIAGRLATKHQLAKEVVFAHNGKEALDLIKESKFDLILLDINMPTMDGFEFLEAFTKLDVTGGHAIPPVFLLTTSVHPRDMDLAAQYPSVQGYFNKPFSKEHVHHILSLSLETLDLESMSELPS